MVQSVNGDQLTNRRLGRQACAGMLSLFRYSPKRVNRVGVTHRRGRHPDTVGVFDGRTCRIPMVNKTGATPVKIPDDSLFPFLPATLSSSTVLWPCCSTSSIRVVGMAGMTFGISIMHYLRAHGPTEVIGFIYRGAQARKSVR